jgi:hypothetical protein
MMPLPEFRTRVLEPLLRGENPAVDTPLTLFAAMLERPLDYLFESDRWDELSGAARRLAQGWTKARAVLAADGYPAEYLLHCDGGSLLALVHDRAIAERWAVDMERIVAAETDLVTAATLVHPVTMAQIANGLYATPRTVIGVPGMNDYQERINRYYGLSSPSTVPKEDAVMQRRHFGEVVALVHLLLVRAVETRQVVPFYEALPFAERCASCRVRPAERIEDSPVCGVCMRKRGEAQGQAPERAGLVWLEAVGLDRVLEQQRTPSAYQRTYTEIDEALHIAVPNRLGATVLASQHGWMLLALPAPQALEAATSALEALTLHYRSQSPTPFIAAVALGTAPNQCRSLHALVQRMLLGLRQASPGIGSLLDVRVASEPFDRFRKPYTLDDARRLITGAAILQEETLPAGLFPDLAEQTARGNAMLYYTFERSKLPEKAQEAFKRLESAWNVGATPGPRFYAMLSDALALARVNA